MFGFFDYRSGKGFISPSDGCEDVQVHIAALHLKDEEVLSAGLWG
ncbi:cold shock domain-containing protein [Edwardsiella ictaluri]|uniref:Cold shock domain-containing protein n=1 Tax=Edwardsiella ictaluri TaxID=67780 RepID=A0ABY8GEP4_EDWIC|nr:cold shock domain-containing protein [Edwardsiella ictaluri]EKS7763205.1 cold shock domain-containing protein [Edwardsiella ictaluri]EKS7770183.1 cold shock domain-containing protein [Edwardsiella ictaluri]EKS7773324.1 cold shock domain-containing protein [Edwardsiella ictaluri]EKS7776716.1 cold shock domain-containing protein [Edwardsiella ictaluri]EKS7786844.1 cold shock domain-containing protein [Edwardsiella ictaluri]